MAILDIIKYEGDNSTFIWKHPKEDFYMNSQLIVHESQEALFFKDGQALDLFGPGRYTLDSKNIPLIKQLLGLATGGDSPFHCEVYFINKATQMAVKWGTDSKVQYMDPVYKFPISIGASGEMSLKAVDAKRLIFQLVGTENFWGHTQLIAFFRAFLMTKIKTYIAQVMKVKAISIFEVDEHLDEFTKELHECLTPDFKRYGVSLERFFVTNIVKPDGEADYEKFKSLHFRQYADVAEAKLRQQVGVIEQQTQAQKMVIESQGIAQKRSIEGYTYQQERGFDVAEKIAQNEGVGEFSNLGIGLGVMNQIGGSVGNAMSGIINESVPPIVDTPPNKVRYCDNCGTKLNPDTKFCDECGAVQKNGQTACKSCGYVFERPGKFCPKCGIKREA